MWSTKAENEYRGRYLLILWDELMVRSKIILQPSDHDISLSSISTLSYTKSLTELVICGPLCQSIRCCWIEYCSFGFKSGVGCCCLSGSKPTVGMLKYWVHGMSVVLLGYRASDSCSILDCSAAFVLYPMVEWWERFRHWITWFQS